MNDDYVHGINKMKKPSTKVMAPPGGQTSINLFGGPVGTEQPKVNKCQASRNQSNVFGSPEQKPAPVQSQPSAVPTPAAEVKAAPSQSAAATAPAADVPSKAPARPSTKVMAPPGGKSSINLFG